MVAALALLSGCASVLNSDFVRWASDPNYYYSGQAGTSVQAQEATPGQGVPIQQQMQMPMQQQYGQPVYRAQDCIGAVVNGVCHGSTGAAQPQATCYGQMLNGQCTGPQF